MDNNNALSLSKKQRLDLKLALVEFFDKRGIAKSFGISPIELAEKAINSFESKFEKRVLALKGIYLN